MTVAELTPGDEDLSQYGGETAGVCGGGGGSSGGGIGDNTGKRKPALTPVSTCTFYNCISTYR